MAANPQPAASTPTVKLLLNGQFVDSKSKSWRDVVNPATQQVLARVPMCDAQEVGEAVRIAAEAFKTWKNVPIGQRARIMLKLQELIRRDMKKIAATLTAEQGKTLPDAEGDIFRGLEVVEHACSIGTLDARRVRRERGRRRGHLLHPPAAGRMRRHHAVQLPRDDPAVDVPHGDRVRQHVRAEALRAGPDDHDAPRGAGRRSGRACGVLNVVHGGKEAVDALCTHPDVKAVSFVGSCHVGEHVYKLSSDHGKRAQCMMGAKNHAVVMPDANKERLARRARGRRVRRRRASAAWRPRWPCSWAMPASGFPTSSRRRRRSK
jgi:malonate-semialdehyde dehydrogenase (acetylating)/methylmalonate-semialdehyde dehydrogenase